MTKPKPGRPMSEAAYERLAERVRARAEGREAAVRAVTVNAYAQGRRLEMKVISDLRAAGFVTMRSAGSKGVIDVLAVRPGELLMVQVKRSSAPGPKEWNSLYDLAEWCGAVPVLATCEPYQPIRWQRIVFRKPLPTKAQASLLGIEATGVIPYPLRPTEVLEEAPAEEPEDETEMW